VNTTTAPIVASFVADNEGLFSVELPKGTYSIITEEQLNTINALDLGKDVEADKKCIEEWWTKPLVLIKVSGDVKLPAIIFEKKCFIKSDIPCLRYTGPLPP
jgi:hypothetical protein